MAKVKNQYWLFIIDSCGPDGGFFDFKCSGSLEHCKQKFDDYVNDMEIRYSVYGQIVDIKLEKIAYECDYKPQLEFIYEKHTLADLEEAIVKKEGMPTRSLLPNPDYEKSLIVNWTKRQDCR